MKVYDTEGVQLERSVLEAHKTTHEDGGADEISVAGLSGELADRQKSKCGDSTLGWTADKLLKGAGVGNPPEEVDVPVGGYTEGARVYHNANQSIPNVTWTYLAFNSERYDTDNIHDNVTNNSRLTCNTAGKYIISAQLFWTGNSTGYRQINIYINGISSWVVDIHTSPGTDAFSQIATTICDLAVGDYVEVRVLQNSGVALTVEYAGGRTPEFMMQRIG